MNFRTILVAVCYSGVTGLLSSPVLAQDSAFLACAQYSDRGQRIACLEDALEAATAAAQEESITTSTPTAEVQAPVSTVAMPVEPASETRPVTRAAEPSADVGSSSSLLERIRGFGTEETTTISSDESGQDQLHDTITSLEKRNDLWIVTLASGQVWRQEVARFLNLREGDEIRIYRAGIGNGYRMATPRLSGFIRVERVK